MYLHLEVMQVIVEDTMFYAIPTRFSAKKETDNEIKFLVHLFRSKAKMLGHAKFWVSPFEIIFHKKSKEAILGDTV